MKVLQIPVSIDELNSNYYYYNAVNELCCHYCCYSKLPMLAYKVFSTNYTQKIMSFFNLIGLKETSEKYCNIGFHMKVKI